MASQPYRLCELGTTDAGFDLGTTQVMELGTAVADFQNNVRERVTGELGIVEAQMGVVTITYREAQVLEMGAEDAGFNVTATISADTRDTWLDVTASADSECHEVLPLVRTKQVARRPYGTVTVYGRRFILPRGDVGQAILETTLARGSHMKTIWADEWFSLKLDGPKAGDIEIQQEMKDDVPTGADIAAVSFVAIKTLNAVVDGYNQTANLRPRADNAFGGEGVTYGIAPSRDATGVPKAGDVLQAYQPHRTWRCTGVEFDEDALPGRVLVVASWRRYERETALMEPTDG